MNSYKLNELGWKLTNSLEVTLNKIVNILKKNKNKSVLDVGRSFM